MERCTTMTKYYGATSTTTCACTGSVSIPSKPSNNTSSSGGGGSNNKTSCKYERLRRKGLGFIASLLKLTRRKNNNYLTAGMRIDSGPNQTTPPGFTPTIMQQRPAICTAGVITSPRDIISRRDTNHDGVESMDVSRISSTLSVATVDVVPTCRQAGTSGSGVAKGSPSHSILTLTPGRTRNIDQDMETLRRSRQDNPYLQILASKENLIESIEESESDDAILMSQEFRDTDPLTLAQVHEHLVRSPPPASWTRTSMFHFPHQQQPSPPQLPQQQQANCPGSCRNSSPKSLLHRSTEDHITKSEGSMEIRDRHSHTFSLLNPTPIRSLSEVRRLHRSAEDSVQLMSSD